MCVLAVEVAAYSTWCRVYVGYSIAIAVELNWHTTRMKTRGSVVSLTFIFPRPPEDKKKKKEEKNVGCCCSVRRIVLTPACCGCQQTTLFGVVSRAPLEAPTPELECLV